MSKECSTRWCKIITRTGNITVASRLKTLTKLLSLHRCSNSSSHLRNNSHRWCRCQTMLEQDHQLLRCNHLNYLKNKCKNIWNKMSSSNSTKNGKGIRSKITKPSKQGRNHLRSWASCRFKGKEVTRSKAWLDLDMGAQTASTLGKSVKRHSTRNTKLRTSARRTILDGLIRGPKSSHQSPYRLKAINSHHYQNQRSLHIQKDYRSSRIQIIWIVWRIRRAISREDRFGC